MGELSAWWSISAFAGNTGGTLVAFAGVLFVAGTAAKVVQWLVHSRLRRWADASETQLDDALLDALERPVTLLL